MPRDGQISWTSSVSITPRVINRPTKAPHPECSGGSADFGWLRDPSWVKTLLSNESLAKQTEDAVFQKFDKDRNHELDFDEIHELCASLCSTLGLHDMNEEGLQKLVDTCHGSHTTSLEHSDFHKFFSVLLRNVQNNTAAVLEPRQAELNTCLQLYATNGPDEAKELSLSIVEPPGNAENVTTSCDKTDKGLVVTVAWQETCEEHEFKYHRTQENSNFKIERVMTGKKKTVTYSRVETLAFDPLPGAEAENKFVPRLLQEDIQELESINQALLGLKK